MFGRLLFQGPSIKEPEKYCCKLTEPVRWTWWDQLANSKPLTVASLKWVMLDTNVPVPRRLVEDVVRVDSVLMW